MALNRQTAAVRRTVFDQTEVEWFRMVLLDDLNERVVTVRVPACRAGLKWHARVYLHFGGLSVNKKLTNASRSLLVCDGKQLPPLESEAEWTGFAERGVLLTPCWEPRLT
jgi:hypothetical protein